MEVNNVHYRHILLYYFKKSKRAAKAHKKICRVYGDDALTERVCQKWFAKFRSGDFDVNDAPRSGRPIEIDSSNVKAIIDKNPSQSVREIATALNISHIKRRKQFAPTGIRFSAQCVGAA
ncbi:Histone-lysine N-methyltransferase SETMAR [Ooceraea biroi]|uniref:Histone-lysine N-methyltransferase SETMAR n=1 Tax=Ooceraea biroi TaxID=2015173 RepID=A0A026WCY4_OOCBI|nr:Histone-lysine N-methyltransferase SETMAR [Ooceraea biroi]